MGFQRSLQQLFLSNAARIRYASSLPALENYVDPPGIELPQGFSFFPEFLDENEQRVLLAAALRKLDGHGSQAAKRSLKRSTKGKDIYRTDTPAVQDLFLPEESRCYDFEEGHFDGVIQHFREMHVTRWSSDPPLESVLSRLRTLFPAMLPQDAIMTHLLHLSSKGQILPHVDNVDASGSWIAAVSLGHERILKMEGPTTFKVLLPSGSAYVQRNTVRYTYKHSILRETTFKARHIISGQRISVMLRNRITNGPAAAEKTTGRA